MRPARFLGFLFLFPVISLLRAAEALTLEQALASVERVNLTALLARENVVQANEQALAQRANVLPAVTGSAQQRRSRAVSVVNGSAVAGAPASRFDAQLTGAYTLLDLSRLSNVRAARVGAEAAESTYRAVLQDVLADVANTFFTHQRNVRRIAVLDANIARARTLLALARNQLNAGVATQIDVTRAEAQLAQAEQARLQQETAVIRSEYVLKRLLDLNPSSPLTLEGFNVRRADVGEIAVGAEKTLFEQRADYLAARRAVEQSRILVSAVGQQRLPALTLSGSYGLAAAEFDDRQKEAWSAGLGLSIPLFEGGRIGSDRRTALSRQRASEARLHTLELQISADLRVSRQDANSRHLQVAVAEKSLRLSEEELRLAQQRYQNGVADNREVVEAQTRLAVADDNLVEAVYQYHVSRVELARVRGDVRSVLAERAP